MEQKLLKDVKKGEFFTKKPIEEPKETQVFIRGEYDKSEKNMKFPVFLIFATRHILRARQKFTLALHSEKNFKEDEKNVCE